LRCRSCGGSSTAASARSGFFLSCRIEKQRRADGGSSIYFFCCRRKFCSSHCLQCSWSEVFVTVFRCHDVENSCKKSYMDRETTRAVLPFIGGILNACCGTDSSHRALVGLCWSWFFEVRTYTCSLFAAGGKSRLGKHRFRSAEISDRKSPVSSTSSFACA
jgi:hypothetical protein